jgi:hypothetical protein
MNKITIPVYMSLTTLPMRLIHSKTQKVIRSILNSTIQPEKIIINIPLRTLKNHTYPLHLLHKAPFTHPLIEIHYVEKDRGPILKLDGILDYLYQHQIETKAIILIDDDIIYPPHLLKILWKYHLQKPNHSIGFTGRKWNINQEQLILKSYIKKNIEKPDFFPCDLLETFHMVLHPYKNFKNRYDEWKYFLNETFEICPESIYTDDIVIGLWNKNHNVKQFIVRGLPIKIITKDLPKLSDINLGLKGNNIYVYKKICI